MKNFYYSVAGKIHIYDTTIIRPCQQLRSLTGRTDLTVSLDLSVSIPTELKHTVLSLILIKQSIHNLKLKDYAECIKSMVEKKLANGR